MIRHLETGVLFRAEEPEQMAWSIKRVFEDAELARRLSKSARNWARSEYDSQKSAERMIAIYKECLSFNSDA